jgi:hypothetical protein
MGRIISTTSTYEILDGKPIDNRLTNDTNANRDLIPTSYRYEGLLVYVSDPNGDFSVGGKLYQLVGGVTNTDWKEIKNETTGVTNGIFTIDGNTGVGTGVVEIGSPDVDDLQVYQIEHNLGKTLLEVKTDIYFIEDSSISPTQRERVAADQVYSDPTDPTNYTRVNILPPQGALERIEIVLHSI